jgi:hypothetical protein
MSYSRASARQQVAGKALLHNRKEKKQSVQTGKNELMQEENMKHLYGKLPQALIAIIALSLLVVGCSDDDNGSNNVNRAPQNVQITLSNTTLPSNGGTVTVTVSATDPDGDQLNYTYNVTLGTVTPNGSQATWVLSPNTGTNDLQGQITVTVSDGTANAQATAGVTVQGQQAASGATISGRLYFPPGPSVDLSNAQFAIYLSYADWAVYNPLMSVAATGSGASVNYTLTGIPEDSYLLEGWSDRDGDLQWSSGDAVGWYGSGAWGAPNFNFYPVLSGQSYNVEMQMVLIP